MESPQTLHNNRFGLFHDQETARSEDDNEDDQEDEERRHMRLEGGTSGPTRQSFFFRTKGSS